ncbi:MAG: peptidylprolyl isomerase [Cyanobacteria bacterium SZAS-4]|nr:peptidylprolyl isomerase [Cyanobacteria bacterium SZAS-4]
MKSRTVKINSAPHVVIALSFSVMLLSSCSKTDEKVDTTKTTTATTTTTTTTTSAPDAKAGKEQDLPDGLLPQIEAARKVIKLGKMPDSDVICTVAGTPITIGQYRKTLLGQEEQIQASLSSNKEAAEQLVAQAKKEGLSLTADEKKRLLETAQKAENASGGIVKKHLEQAHETAEHFNQYVLDLGLAFKVSTAKIEETLLHQLVDREILCGAARTKGYGPAAYNVYIDAKKNKAFDKMIAEGMNKDQLRDDIVQGELVKRMIESIRKSATVSEADIQKLYDQNKEKFKHGDLIKLSQIVIAAPSKDSPQQPSMRTQLKQQEPKISNADLDKKVKIVEQQQHQKAQELLDKALKGADFAKLANESTDDIASRAAKIGGDMGYQDKSHMLKEFAAKVDTLKAGQIYPSLITSEFGYHIIKVTDRKPGGVQPLSEVKEDLRAYLKQSAEAKALHDWLIEKRKATDIRLSPEFQALVNANKSQTKAP